MTFEQAQEKALQYAQKNGYSTIRKAGERDGFWYFRICNVYPQKMYLGLPQYVKISQTTNEILRSEGLSEAMWALRNEKELN